MVSEVEMGQSLWHTCKAVLILLSYHPPACKPEGQPRPAQAHLRHNFYEALHCHAAQSGVLWGHLKGSHGRVSMQAGRHHAKGIVCPVKDGRSETPAISELHATKPEGLTAVTPDGQAEEGAPCRLTTISLSWVMMPMLAVGPSAT